MLANLLFWGVQYFLDFYGFYRKKVGKAENVLRLVLTNCEASCPRGKNE
jgi:hypothetical protein